MTANMLRRVVSTFITMFVLILAVGLLYVHLSSAQLLSVQSGSMQPAINVGDVVVVSSVPETLAVGDVVTFISADHNDALVTHRISSINHEEAVLVTRGDANSADDQPIALESVVGKVSFRLPYAGTVFSFMQQPIGLVFLIYIPALVIIRTELRRLAQYFKARQPYRHPLLKFMPQPKLSTRQKLQKTLSVSLALVIMVSAVSVPAWAFMFDTASLTGNTITTKLLSTKADHIVIRELAFRCSRFNSVSENVRPSIVLYNPTREKFELEGWTLESSDGVIVTFDEDDSLRRKRNLRLRPHLENGLLYAGDRLVLKDAEGFVVDAMSWGDDTSIFNPALPAGDASVRFQRRPKYRDTNTADDFRVKTYRNCSHSCFNFDPWEVNSETSVEIHITHVSEATVGSSN